MTAMMVEAAARGLLLAIAVGAGLQALRVTYVPARKAVWSLVLVASLAMPFLMRWPGMTQMARGMAWVVPLHRVLPAPVAAAQPMVVTDPVVTPATKNFTRPGLAACHKREAALETAAPAALELANESPSRMDSAASAGTAAKAALGATDPHPRQWPTVGRLFVWVYLAVGGALLLRLVWGVVAAVWLWSGAEEISPLDIPEAGVRVSPRIPSPVTIGSGIVLPPEFATWDRTKLRVVLAHERSHVRQMDFYLQLLAGLYTAIFWFSPLGWWLRRELGFLGEAISDRAGLDAAASRSGYAEIVLQFAAMPRRNLPGVAMARTGNVSKRIERLLSEPLLHRAFAEGKRRALVSLLLVPAALFGVTALIRVPAAHAQNAPPAPPASAPAPAVAPTPVPAPEDVPSAETPSPAPPSAAPSPAAEPEIEPDAPQSVVPDAAQAPAAPVAPSNSSSATAILKDGRSVTEQAPDATAFINNDDTGVSGYDYEFSNDHDSWAFVGPSTRFSFSGHWEDDLKGQIDKARRMAHGSFLWFSRDGKSYIVDDPAIVERLRQLNRPIDELGQEQEALGKQQEALGRQQEELARQQQEAAKVRMPDLSKEMAQLDAEMAAMKAAQGKMMTQEQLGEMQAKFGEMQARLGELQGEAGAIQGEFGGKMGELGRQQGTLGARQGRLGAEQGRLARQADQEVRSIIEQTLQNGKARPVQ